MPTHPIVNYIRQARERGMTNKQVIEALTGAGWHIHDVMGVLLDENIVIEPTLPVDENSIITARNVVKSYGHVKALDGVSLDVQRGNVTALLGPNGAGKTTLVRIMTTLLNQDSGRVVVAGYDVTHNAQELRSVIGLTGQFAAIDDSLTGRENLEMVGRLYHFDKQFSKNRAAELLNQFELDDAADRVAKTYSGGMRRRLDIAASLVSKPRVLFLDEPTTGLDPRSRFALWRVIRELVEQGTTVLLTTQYMEEADQLAHQIFVIDHGHIIAQGTADELKRQIGGDILEIHVSDRSLVDRVAQTISKFGKEEPRPDEELGTVSMAVEGGASVLVDVVRELDAAHLKITDIVLRRPSLDDVFMKLTGHGATVN